MTFFWEVVTCNLQNVVRLQLTAKSVVWYLYILLPVEQHDAPFLYRSRHRAAEIYPRSPEKRITV